MASDLLGISTSGLLVAQQQIGTTGHNIANVNTPGYARQNTTSISRIPGYTGNGYVGTGVEVESTKRSYNEFLEELIRSSNSQLGKQEQYHSIAVQIDNILGDPDAGLTPVLEEFYGALEEANDYPSSVPTRSVLLTNAQSLVDRFDFLNDRLSDLNDQVNDKLKDVTNEVTSAASSLAELNAQIIYQIGSSAGSASVPNDVLDQREELIKTISERVEANVVYQDNGAANIFIGSGQALVLNTDAFSMELDDNEFTPRDKEILLTNKNGTFNITEQIKGGELEGLVNVKKEILESGFNAMGRIAAGITKEMNEQHELGMTLQPNADGGFNLGSNFFNDLDTSQNAYRSDENSTGDLISFKITDTNSLTLSDYELEQIDAGTLRIKRLSDNTSITGATIADLNTILSSDDPTITNFDLPQGFQIDVPAPALTVGDKFLIQPTRDLSRNIRLEIDDVKDVALAAPIQVRAKTDDLGVGQNQGTTSMEFVPFSPDNVKRDLDGNLVDSAGNLVGLPLEATAPFTQDYILLDQFDETDNTFVMSGPGITLGTKVSYDPETQSGTEIALGEPFEFMKIKMTGVPHTDDEFYIGNNSTPQDDNRNGLVMAKIQTKKTLENGRADFQRAYSLAVADVGTRTHSSEVDMKAQNTINERAQQNRNSLSGVNLDEEASNLLRFQQSYSASAKVIGVADEVFNTLLQSV